MRPLRETVISGGLVVPHAPSASVSVCHHDAETTETRIERAVSDRLARVLLSGEQKLATVEGIEDGGFFVRTVFGSTWAASRRVVLVITDSRLIEIAMSFSGRHATGRVRSFLWRTAGKPNLQRDRLSIGRQHHWILLTPLDSTVVANISRDGGGTIPVRKPDENPGLWVHCPECFSVFGSNDESPCANCGAIRRSSRLARRLSLAFPGAGILFAGRPGYAAVRFLAEISFLLYFADQLMSAGGLAQLFAILVAWAVVLAFLKAESLRMTQLLVERSGALTRAARKRWKVLGIAGGVVSIIVIMIPFFFIGQTNGEVNGDFDSKIGKHIWSSSRVPEEWILGSDDSSKRAEWTHCDGWIVTACAWPIDPFEGCDKVTGQLLSEPVTDAGYLARSLQLGPHQVVRNVYQSENSEEIHRIVVEYSVCDNEERDLHTLWIEVPENEFEIADQEIQRLIGSFYWIRAKTG